MEYKKKSKRESDLHTHLYGCLSASDVWLLGKTRWSKRRGFLRWYSQQYYLAWGRFPEWEKYWTSDNGYHILRKDFLILDKVSFSQFQACFNLIIALFPIDPVDRSIPCYLLFKLCSQGYRYVEPRVVFPDSFDEEHIVSYLSTLSVVAAKFKKQHSMEVRYIFSLARNTILCQDQYRILKKWLLKFPCSRSYVTGIDFASYEENDPPVGKKAFIQAVLYDNRKNPKTALALMYHVGESYQHISLMSSCRWVWTVHSLGVHRLSHCISLGVDPSSMLGKVVKEPAYERKMHLLWLLENKGLLDSYGCGIQVEQLVAEISTIDKEKREFIEITYDQKLIVEIKKLQEALLKDLSKKGAIIEVCPISNDRIAMSVSHGQHPLHRFIDHQIKVCFGSDDPGIFGFEKKDEEVFCAEKLGVSSAVLANIYHSQRSYRSYLLSDRVNSIE